MGRNGLVVSHVSANKQLERTVIRRHGRAACAAFHCAHAARWTVGHAAAQLRRYAAQKAWWAVGAMFRSNRGGLDACSSIF
jgi:hypothetical protein